MGRIVAQDNKRVLIIPNSTQLDPPSNSRGFSRGSNSTPSEKEKGVGND